MVYHLANHKKPSPTLGQAKKARPRCPRDKEVLQRGSAIGARPKDTMWRHVLSSELNWVKALTGVLKLTNKKGRAASLQAPIATTRSNKRLQTIKQQRSSIRCATIVGTRGILVRIAHMVISLILILSIRFLTPLW